MTTIYPGVTADPEVQPGAPCLSDTRFPTYIVREMGYDLDALRAGWPHLTDEQLATAIRYERSAGARLRRRIAARRLRLAAGHLGTTTEHLRDHWGVR